MLFSVNINRLGMGVLIPDALRGGINKLYTRGFPDLA